MPAPVSERHISMTATVNIGLDSREGRLAAAAVEAVLRVVGGATILRAAVRQSDSEPTYVAELSRPLNLAAAYEVARQLGQDAIAIWDGRQGDLIGPAADAWGEFNPAFFVNLDGSRLASEEYQRAA
jgi:hypothetical protein